MGPDSPFSDQTISQTIMRDLDTKKKTYGASVGRCAPEFTLFHAPTQGHTELNYLALRKKGSLTANEVLGTTQGVKMFAEWAPKTELFQRRKIHEELVGL